MTRSAVHIFRLLAPPRASPSRSTPSRGSPPQHCACRRAAAVLDIDAVYVVVLHGFAQDKLAALFGVASLDAKVIDHHGAASARSQRKVAARTRARADREVATLTILRHANVIAMLGVEYAAGTTRIVLEDGGMDLYRFVVNHGKIDKCEAMGLFHRLVAAVGYPTRAASGRPADIVPFATYVIRTINVLYTNLYVCFWWEKT